MPLPLGEIGTARPSRVDAIETEVRSWGAVPPVSQLQRVLIYMLEEIEQAPLRSLTEDVRETPAQREP
jgi:hypothetical protein